MRHTLIYTFPVIWPVPRACAQPYHPGSGSHGQLFRPCYDSSAWHSLRAPVLAIPRGWCSVCLVLYYCSSFTPGHTKMIGDQKEPTLLFRKSRGLVLRTGLSAFIHGWVRISNGLIVVTVGTLLTSVLVVYTFEDMLMKNAM